VTLPKSALICIPEAVATVGICAVTKNATIQIKDNSLFDLIDHRWLPLQARQRRLKEAKVLILCSSGKKSKTDLLRFLFHYLTI
jgi:hypothetical protein